MKEAHKILIVDDAALNLKTFQRILLGEGFRASTATDGTPADAADIMPTMSGIALSVVGDVRPLNMPATGDMLRLSGKACR